MKKFLTIFIFFLLTNTAIAKDLYFACNGGNKWKVESPFLGKNKIFRKINGEWWGTCILDKDIITEDNFKCFIDGNEKVNFWTFDLKFKDIKYFKGISPNAKLVEKYNCWEVK